MKKILLLVSILVLTMSQVSAHSCRTDKNGGHNCSEASKKKGLCTGYHYHNGGGLHLDATDEIVYLDTTSERGANAIYLEHRVIDDHSEDHQEHTEKHKEHTHLKPASS